MMPGFVQVVRYMKKYMRKMQKRKMIGRAGFTLQFSPTTKTQKGTTMPREQQ